MAIGTGTALGIMAVSQIASSGMEAYGNVQNQKFQSAIADQNAAFRELGAKDAMLKGKQQAEKVRRSANQVRGDIELAAAAQGQSVESGSIAGNLLEETDVLSERDAEVIRNNAMREAFGFKLEAQNIRSQAKLNEGLAWSRAGQTLATGGVNAAQTILRYGSGT